MQLSLPYVLPILVFLVLCMIWAVLLLPSRSNVLVQVVCMIDPDAFTLRVRVRPPAEAFANAAVCLKWHVN